MSNNMDNDISNMDEINALMEDLFAADETATTMVEAVSNEIKKWDGSLEKFSEDDFVRREQLQEWLETNRTGRSPTPPYESMFGGVGQTGLNGLNNQTIQGSDKVIFEKDEMNSSLAGATSAWKEIASITRELKELSSQVNKLSFRFNEFIDIHVKDKIPK